MRKQITIFILIVISITALIYYFSFGSNVDKKITVLENSTNTSINNNTSIVNTSLNTTNNSTENIMLISLEKPSEEVIGG